MLDRESDYVKKYLEKVGKVSADIVSQDYTDLQEYKMSDHYGYVENGSLYFKIVKSKETGICLDNPISDSFKELLHDSNILCVGINRFPPKAKVKEHVDPPYYGKKLWRILVPIKASDAYLKGMNGEEKVVSGNCYIFDITYEFHHGWNSSNDDDFIVATFDILYETDSDNVGEHYWSKYNGNEIYSEVVKYKSVNVREGVLMIDFSTSYYEEYRNKIEDIKHLILQENFTDQTSMKIDWNTGSGNGSVIYSFKKMPRKDFLGRKDSLTLKERYTNSSVEKFFSDERILAFSKITLPAGQDVGEHIDTCYCSKEFFRVHIPLEDTDAVFCYGNQEINWKRGEVYFFDVRHVKHSAQNRSSKNFDLLIIDICIEDICIESIGDVISNKNHDIILSEIKQQDFDLRISNEFI